MDYPSKENNSKALKIPIKTLGIKNISKVFYIFSKTCPETRCKIVILVKGKLFLENRGIIYEI